jgi:hypothetical protein
MALWNFSIPLWNSPPHSPVLYYIINHITFYVITSYYYLPFSHSYIHLLSQHNPC